jgi:hypothetical protein
VQGSGYATRYFRFGTLAVAFLAVVIPVAATLWVAERIDTGDPLETRLGAMSPEEVIRTYVAALDRGDRRTVLACMSRRHLWPLLFYRMAPDALYAPAYSTPSLDDIAAAAVSSIKEVARSADSAEYIVDLVVRTRGGGFYRDGSNQARFFLRRETPTTGWRIDRGF